MSIVVRLAYCSSLVNIICICTTLPLQQTALLHLDLEFCYDKTTTTPSTKKTLYIIDYFM